MKWINIVYILKNNVFHHSNIKYFVVFSNIYFLFANITLIYKYLYLINILYFIFYFFFIFILKKNICWYNGKQKHIDMQVLDNVIIVMLHELLGSGQPKNDSYHQSKTWCSYWYLGDYIKICSIKAKQFTFT